MKIEKETDGARMRASKQARAASKRSETRERNGVQWWSRMGGWLGETGRDEGSE